MPVHHLATTEHQPGPIKQHFAIVQQQTDCGWLVKVDAQLIPARRAAGCLLTPCPGDQVLAASNDIEAWILCVLAREPGKPAVIETTDDMQLKSGGRIALTCDYEVALESDTVRLKSRLFEAMTGKLEWVADRLDARIGSTSYIGRALESLIDHVSQHCRINLRHVDQLDQLSAGRIDRRAESDLSMTAENLIAGARHLAKIDGKQIHVG